jgi:prophage DNA circulation protein
MANDQKIVNGSYRDIPISISAGSMQGGRKSVIKQFPNRNTQSIEDLGLRPRKYSLEIVINDKANQDYFSYRSRLLSALEKSEPAPLIHPLYGRIENVVAVSYNLNERLDEFGFASISVEFEVNANTGIPQQSQNVLSQLVAQNQTVVDSVRSDISSRFKVTNAFAGNFGSAVDKVNEIVSSTKESTAFLGGSADTINSFSSQLGSLSANVNSLVTNPIALADSIVGIFETVNGLYSSVDSTLRAFEGLFDFGANDIEIGTTTAGLSERSQNRGVLNGSVISQALSYSYVSAAEKEYQTTREIDQVAQALENQYKYVLDSDASQETKDNITALRVSALDSLKQSRVNASQVISVSTLPTSARLLAFNYYGNDEQGENIVDLNNFTDVSFVVGDVEILTA